MALRKKYMRKKRYARKKRVYKRRTFKRRPTMKKMRVSRRKRITPARLNLKRQSKRRNYEKFSIMIDIGTVQVSDTDKHLEFRNFSAKDLTDREPDLLKFLYCRVKKATLRWKLKNFDPKYQRFVRARTGTYLADGADIADGANANYFPNATTGAWVNISGSEGTQFAGRQNLNTFSAFTRNAKLHKAYGGMRTFKPYVGMLAESMYTLNTEWEFNELATSKQFFKKFNHWNLLAAQVQSSWMNDIRLILPSYNPDAVQNYVYQPDGVTLKEIVSLERRVSAPFYELTLVVECEARGANLPLTDRVNYLAPPAQVQASAFAAPADVVDGVMLPDKEANTLHEDLNQIKDDVKKSVMDHILGSNPAIAAVAAVAGLRNKRPRDEIK